MLSVSIICVGKLREKYWRDACLEYQKRLSAFCNCSIIEVEEYKTGNRPSKAQIKTVIEEEGKRILLKLPPKAQVISLCIEGKEFSSVLFSKRLEEFMVTGTSHIAFVIGGSWGLSEEMKNRSSLRFSMSRMTFPHQMARVMLLEQIYRAFQIAHSGQYHK